MEGELLESAPPPSIGMVSDFNFNNGERFSYHHHRMWIDASIVH